MSCKAEQFGCGGLEDRRDVIVGQAGFLHIGHGLAELVSCLVNVAGSEREHEIKALEPQADHDRIRELSRVIGQLRKVAPAGKTDAIRLVAADLDKLRMSEFKTGRDIEEINQRLSTSDSDRVQQYDRERRQYEKIVSEFAAKLADLDIPEDNNR